MAVAVGALEVVILKSGWQTAGAVTVVVSIALLALHVIARSAGWVWSGRLLLFAVPVLLASGLALVERALSLL